VDLAQQANVLAVDDSKALLSILRDVLTRGGHQVFLAHSGEEALDLLDQVHIDLVVADLILPAMHGYELCRRIKDLNPKSPIPVLLLTSNKELDSTLAGFAAGANDYILKPFRHQELLVRVRAQLRLKELQEELREKNRKLQRAQEELTGRIDEIEQAYKEIKDHERRTQHDLDLASRVQRALLPQIAPVAEDYLVAFKYEPAASVAGDFFDFHRFPDGRLGMAIGDVAGKGAAASLVMVLAISAFRRVASRGIPPADALKWINEEIQAQYGAREMITLFYGIFDPNQGSLLYCSAGHEPAMLLRAGSRETEHLQAGGPFLGIFPQLDLESGEVSLDPGDRLLLMTDGLLERFEPRNSLKALEKLSLAFQKRRFLSPQDWLNSIPSPMPPGKAPNAATPDDTTAILIEVRGSSE
jgi:sigma-B regulation protein RsbU (phosphoserine phosphatase)